MPIFTGETPIKKNIASGELRSLYVFCGDEPYLKDIYVRRLIAGAVTPGLETFNLKKLDGAECDASDILAAADQMPLMGGKNCCVVRNFPLVKLNAADSAALRDYVAVVPDTTTLIFLLDDDSFPPKQSRDETAEENKDKEKEKSAAKTRKEMMEAFLQYAFIAKLDRYDRQSLIRLLVKGAGSRGNTLSPQNAARLVDSCGNDMHTLLNELNKVSAYAAGGEITAEIIDTVATKTLEATAFEIADNLFAGNTDRAMQALEILLEQKNPPQVILGSLIFPFIDIYRVKLAEKYHQSNAALMKAFSYTSAFRLDKARKNSRKISESGIKTCLSVLDNADMCLKSRGGSDIITLEETLVKLGAVIR
ncbi:MAG: DNA polymerase III subunit delta [Clostridia bacterium]|nr:DNA polymerase III subunit delta [Clostridia bacterium]